MAKAVLLSIVGNFIVQSGHGQFLLQQEEFFLHDRSRWLDEIAENPGKRPEEPEDRPRTCSDLCCDKVCTLESFSFNTVMSGASQL